MAELADALGLGPSVPWDVKVRLLSLVFHFKISFVWSVQAISNLLLAVVVFVFVCVFFACSDKYNDRNDDYDYNYFSWSH